MAYTPGASNSYFLPQSGRSEHAPAGSIPVTAPASARAAVDTLRAMGSGLVKISANDFPPDAFAALIDEARKQGLNVGGYSWRAAGTFPPSV